MPFGDQMVFGTGRSISNHGAELARPERLHQWPVLLVHLPSGPVMIGTENQRTSEIEISDVNDVSSTGEAELAAA